MGTDSGIYVDGVKSASAVFMEAGWEPVFCIKPGIATFEIGKTTVRIQGVWGYNGKYISVKPQQFKYTAENTWSVDESFKPEVTETWSELSGEIYNGQTLLQDGEGNNIGLSVSDNDMTLAKVKLPEAANVGDVITRSEERR